MKHLSLLLVAALSVAACGAEPRTVSYYKAHKDEAKETVAACRDRGVNPLKQDIETQNCLNADKALRLLRLDRPVNVIAPEFKLLNQAGFRGGLNS